MPIFTYKAYSADGKVVGGEIEAASTERALDLLEDDGLIPFSTTERNAKFGFSASLFASPREGRKPSPDEWVEFARELAVLLQAQLPVDQCLRLLGDENRNTPVGQMSGRLHAQLITGVSLADAFENATEAQPLIISVVRAGESRGELASAILELSVFLEKRQLLRNKIRSALTYPMVLAIAALATLAIILTTLVPALLPLFDDAGVEPPIILSVSQAIVDVLGANMFASGAILASLPVALMYASRSPASRRVFHSVILGLPVFGKIVRGTNTALFARTLGTLLKNGLPLVASVSLASNAMTNRAMGEAIKSAQSEIREGSKLSDALRKSGQFSERALRFIAVGEEASRLEEMLVHFASVQEQDTERSIERAMTLLGPALTISIGLVVGGLIVSVMQAILSINELVLR